MRRLHGSIPPPRCPFPWKQGCRPSGSCKCLTSACCRKPPEAAWPLRETAVHRLSVTDPVRHSPPARDAHRSWRCRHAHALSPMPDVHRTATAPHRPYRGTSPMLCRTTPPCEPCSASGCWRQLLLRYISQLLAVFPPQQRYWLYYSASNSAGHSHLPCCLSRSRYVTHQPPCQTPLNGNTPRQADYRHPPWS